MSAKMPLRPDMVGSNREHVKQLNSLLMDGSLSPATYQRWTSFREPRDLTLGGRGGAATGKKHVMPNLNVARNKNVNIKDNKDLSATSSARGRGRDKVKGMARKQPNTHIQTTGVFSEGAGALKKPKYSSSKSYISLADSHAQMRKPVLVKNEIKQQIDKKDENAFDLCEIVGDGYDHFADKKTDVQYMPVRLKQVNKQFKEEAEEEDEKKVFWPQNVEQFFTNTQPQLLMVQFPYGICEHENTDDVKKTSQPNDDNKTANSNVISSTTNIFKKSQPDGRFGKLLRYKSGKVKLVLNQAQFDFDLCVNPGIPQDIMSICAEKDKLNQMINLGALSAKFTVTPEWETLMQQQQQWQ